MTEHRIKVGDRLKVSFEGTVEELHSHDGCVKIDADFTHHVYLPDSVVLGEKSYTGVTVELLEPELIAGKAYQDADGDVLLRTSDDRWVTLSGGKRSDSYAHRPLKLLIPQD